MLLNRKSVSAGWIAAMVLSYTAVVLEADAGVKSASDEWLSSGCPDPTHCTCYFTESPVSTLPLRTANCSGLVFSSTKFRLSRQTESLVVSGSHVDLPILTAVMFRDGTEIRELVLSGGHLHSFDGLAAPETLESVVASHNELVSLPDATFVRLASLTLLDLSYCRLEVIHRFAFAGLFYLRQLDLSGNHLSGAFEGLRWVCRLPSLKVLNLSHNGIHVIDDSTFACSLPPPPLPRWWSKSAELAAVASNVTSAHLQVLDLSWNRIRHIHHGAFIGLGRVDDIRLHDNALSVLPTHVIQLTTDVEAWDFSGNEFEVLEMGSFEDNQHLRELRLNRMHQLRMVDAGAFANLTSLRRLELSHNSNLRYVSRRAFVDVPVLTNLLLTDSALDTFELEIIESLPSLRELNISGSFLPCDCIVRSVLRHIENRGKLNSDMNQNSVCSVVQNSSSLNSSYQLRHVTVSSYQHSTATRSRSTTNGEVEWQSTTAMTNFVLNSTETLGNLSAAVQNRTDCSPRILPLFDTDMYVTVTDTVRVDCRAVGFPIPTVSWLLPVDIIDDVSIPDDTSASHGTEVVISNGTLLINAVAMRHHGNYTCLADDGGNHSDQRSVFVHVKPPGTSLILVHVTSSTVTVTWRGLHSYREYRIRYCEKLQDINETLARSTEILVKPYMRAFTASGLKPETEYTFCIDVRPATFVSWYHTVHHGHFVAVDCTNVATRHRKYEQPLARSLFVHVMTGAAATIASLGTLIAISTILTRRYDRRKLQKAALQSASVSSGGILLQRDDDVTADRTGSITSFAAAVAASVTFENRAAVAGVSADSDDCDFVAMFDSDDLDEIRATATMQRL